jgi:uncharacterized protein (DUF608 family)
MSEAFFSHDELYSKGKPKALKGKYLREVAFPLGGLGTGCISLTGEGNLVDWEIFNRPNKGTLLHGAFFAIWAKAQGEAPVAKVLQAPPQPPYSGQGREGWRHYGHTYPRQNGAGFPHMRKATFRGEFPLAWIDFRDELLPVKVTLEAYSPFIPGNADDSGLPIAVLHWQIANDSDKTVEVSLAGSLPNCIGSDGRDRFIGEALGQNVNTWIDEPEVRGLMFTSNKYDADAPVYGSMALTTSWPNVWRQSCWLRVGWFDREQDFWDNFSATGRLEERNYGPSNEGHSDIGTLGLRVTLAPGEKAELPFYLSWYMPNFTKYWRGVTGASGFDGELPHPQWKNYYASLWSDAFDVARYYATHRARLYAETARFHDVLFSSTLPPYVLDAISSQASILHSPTVSRLPDGTLYGFEGCTCDRGSCEGSCTHVWNYAQTNAFLFPALERSLRDIDYTYNLAEDGKMCFRLQLPLGSPRWDFDAAADGQLGGVLKTYRDWKLCGDDAWLRNLWPKVKKALAYAWIQWDADQDGVIDGVQHNTYDIEFKGPNPMIGGFYLGALRAAEEMARHLDDPDAALYRCLFESGRSKYEALTYNGEFYVQKYDPQAADKYQFGAGCLADQMIGQWMAHIVGLGYVFEPGHVRSALQAVFKHNWRRDLWEHANAQRIYALNDEQGLLLCTWPNGGRPTFPFPYSDEVWCGIEYQVASHLIYEGFVDEGLSIVKGVRDRHDGYRRNPWNEYECGSHYARSMSSWAVLTALSGYSFDAVHKAYGFSPRIWMHDWRSFWSTDSGWGSYAQAIEADKGEASLSVAYGMLEIARLALGSIDTEGTVSAALDGVPVPCTAAVVGGRLEVSFTAPVTVGVGQTLRVMVS